MSSAGARQGASINAGAAAGHGNAAADGQWHSFANSRANAGSESVRPTAINGARSGQWQSFAASSGMARSNPLGNRANGAAGVRSFSGQGHNIVENTPRAAAGVAGTRSTAVPASSAFLAGRAGTSTSRFGSPLGFGTGGSFTANGFRGSGSFGNGWGRFGGNAFGGGFGWRRPFFSGFGFGCCGGFGWNFGYGLGLGWGGPGFYDPFWYSGFWDWPAYGYPSTYGYYGPDTGIYSDPASGPDYGSNGPNYSPNSGNFSSAPSTPDSGNYNPSLNNQDSSAPASNSVTSDRGGNDSSTVPGAAAASMATLYFKDGTQVVANDYWLANNMLHYVRTDGSELTIDVDKIDLQKTIDENTRAGVKFWLRSSPNI